MKITYPLTIALLAVLAGSCSEEDGNQQPIPGEDKELIDLSNYTLVHQEDFSEISDIDDTEYETTYLAADCHFSKNLLTVENNTLVLSAELLAEELAGKAQWFGGEEVNFSSKVVTSAVAGNSAEAQTEGYVEIKANFPAVSSQAYPKFMLYQPSAEYPAGEAGITSRNFLLQDNRLTFVSLAVTAQNRSSFENDGIDRNINFAGQYNTYGLAWNSKGYVKFYLNGEKIGSSTYVDWIKQGKAANWAIYLQIDPDNYEDLGQKLQVDYIKVYQVNDNY